MQNQQVHTPLPQAQPLVTFIVACYNLPVPMLCECIDSLLALSLSAEEREIIIVDDGSDVSPMNGLMHYGDDIIYVRQRNGGVSVARNTGLNMARGKYVQLIDGDDCLLKQPYEQCLDIIRQHPDTDVVLFDFTHTQTSTDTDIATDTIISGTDYMRSHNMRGAACCCLFRQAVRGQLAFTPGIAYGEDEEFTPLLLLRAEAVRPTGLKAYYYRERPSSAVHQTDDASLTKRLDDTLAVVRHLNQAAATLPQTDRLAMQRRVAQLTMDYIYNIIMLTRSRTELDSRLQPLRAEGLFPLPDRNYSQKYRWFRRMSATSLGRTILLRTLPLLKKER